jgi:hypothetical protein
MDTPYEASRPKVCAPTAAHERPVLLHCRPSGGGLGTVNLGRFPCPSPEQFTQMTGVGA